MGKKDQIKHTIAAAFSLPKEVVLDLPLISLTGNEEMKIENYKGIIEYSEDKLRINTSIGILKIEGKKLALKEITSEDIQITGQIEQLTFMI